MMILKIIGKIVLMPILLLIGITRLVLNTAAKIYCFVAVWFWLFLAVCAVVTVVNQRWDQTFLLVIVGAVTFGALFGGLMMETFFKELGDYLKQI